MMCNTILPLNIKSYLTISYHHVGEGRRRA
jgi:hypothetical protein